jgi:hypothetical protein
MTTVLPTYGVAELEAAVSDLALGGNCFVEGVFVASDWLSNQLPVLVQLII